MTALAQGGRAGAWLAFFGLDLAAWSAAFLMAAGAAPGWLCLPGDVALLPFGGLPVLLAMWAAMTAAMMLPTLAPTLAAYLRLPAAVTAGGGPAALVAGFLAVWTAASVFFALAQAGLIRLQALDTSGALIHPAAAGALMLVAGAWQFSRTKTACLTACLRPELRFLARLSPGPASAARAGAEAGLNCVACCWALMALGFVGGVMSLLWMGLATLFMVLEKLPELGDRLRRPAGALLIAGGLALAARALF